MTGHIIKRRVLPFAIAASLLVVGACDNSDPGDEAPALFLDDTFELGTDFFDPSAQPKTAAGIHFGAAALRVWPVSLILTANLILPAAVTHAATQVDPVFEDDAWHWSTTTTAYGQQTISLDLSATPSSPGHDWSMIVSFAHGAIPITDFELFSAHTENNGTEGSWQLFYPDGDESVNVLDAEFNKDSETDKQLTFAIPDDAAQNAGDSVTYTEDGDLRTFRWIQVDAELQTYVEWDHVTQEGSITATNYNSGEKACWDADLEDVVCP
jgi:hypothetical protein